MKDQEINFTREAFMHPMNLTFLLVAMLVTLVGTGVGGGEFFMNTMLLFAGAAELLYLGMVPNDPRFQRVIRSRKAKERQKAPSQKDLFSQLDRESRQRYTHLRTLQKDIQHNYEKLSYASQGILNSHLGKLENLLTSFLNLLYQYERYELALSQTSESEVTATITALRMDLETDPPRVRAVKERRLRILENRLARFKKSRENIRVLEEQIETIEEAVTYIHEQSLTMRNPEEITFQLDKLLTEVEETEASVVEIEEMFAPGGGLRTPTLDEPSAADRRLLDELDGLAPERDSAPIRPRSRTS